MELSMEMKTVALPSGERVPALGMGTWRMGEDFVPRRQEVATLRRGLDLGLRVIDTAEMYGDGSAEEIVGEAIRGRHDDAFVVSKVLPHHATRIGTAAACEGSLRRMRTDRIDLYLLHWRGPIHLTETLYAFQDLLDAGKIRYWGVGNFDIDDMEDLFDLAGGTDCATDQILYNLTRRGPELNLLPWLRRHRIPIMAYSPIEQARLIINPDLVRFAQRYGMTPAQAALAWLVSNDDVIPIPKTSRIERLQENVAAMSYQLTAEQLQQLDRLFPAPSHAVPLEII
jgi:diketogulonate reductase-like aldo/keto reductase